MTILVTLGPLLAALIIGFSWNIKGLSTQVIDTALKWLTFAILALIGYSIGSLDDLQTKLYQAGFISLVLFAFIVLFNIGFLTVSGKYLNSPASRQDASPEKVSIVLNWATFSDSVQTIIWVVVGCVVGYFSKGFFEHADALVAWMLYLLLFLVGQQLMRANYRLRSLFINVQGLIICFVTMLSTLLAGAVGAYVIDLPIYQGLAVVSGFGWYSLSGIILSDLGYPLLGTTAFLLDIGREVFALVMIPLLSRINNHCGVGVSGATAMDFTLPMLGKFHGATIIPTAIASGFLLSIFVPILIPLFMSFSA
ncbi:MAG: putative surface protein [Osedax symbiont Rs1]|nr:MAG: putative surface protein [Osedax symbiont Rs1]